MSSRPELVTVPEGLSPEGEYRALCQQLSKARERKRVLEESLPEGMTREAAIEERNRLVTDIPGLEEEIRELQRAVVEDQKFPGYIVVGDTILVLSQFENENGRHLKVEKVIEGAEPDGRLANVRPGITTYKADLSNAPNFIKEAVDTKVFLKDEKGYDFSERYEDIPDTDSEEEVEETLSEAA